MDEGTAVLDAPDTAAITEAPPEIDPTETASELFATETEAAPPTETDTAEDAPEDELPTDPEAMQALIDKKVAWERAKIEESFKQRDENRAKEAKDAAERAAYEQNLALTSAQGQQWLANQFYLVAKDAADRGLDAPDPKAFGGVVQRYAMAATTNAFNEVMRFDDQAIAAQFPGYRVPTELNQPYVRAVQSGDPRAVSAARMAIIADAAAQAGYERGKAEALAQATGKAKAKAGTDALKAESAARASQGKPTPGLASAAAGGGKLTPERLKAMTREQISEYMTKPGGEQEIDRVTALIAGKKA